MGAQTILRPLDVVQFTPVKFDFNACSFRELARLEQIEAINCLGVEFYEQMLGAIADYSDATEYEASRTYETGNAVYWRGGYRIAKEQTTANPDDVTKWQDAPRFTPGGACSTEYETFFCEYLGPWLAHVVLSKRLPYIVTQIRDTGIEYGGRKINQQDDKRYTSLEAAIFRDREEAYQLMEFYLKREENRIKPCFANWVGKEPEEHLECTCGKQTCDECRQKRPRYVGRNRWG